MALRGLLTVVLAGIAIPWAAVPAAAEGVRADDTHNTFVIRAGTPATDSGEGGCSDCATVIAVPVCIDGIQFVSPQPGFGCLELDGRCPTDERFVRQWTAGPQGWVQGDVGCVDLSGAPTIAQIAAAVRDSVVRRVPSAEITTQPRARALVRVPLLLDSGQRDGPLTWNDQVAGVPVTTTVSPTWEWTFGDGARLATAQAGSRWPDTAVSHTFADPGRYRVTVTAQWSGSYVIAGLGAQPIDGSVNQSADVAVSIHTAGAVLEPVLR